MQAVATFEAHDNYVLALAFGMDGQTLASAGMDASIRLWSAPDWRLLGTLTGHTHSVNSLTVSPNGQTLASTSTDATVRLWSFPDGVALHVLQDRKKTVTAAEFSPDGRWLAAGSYGGRVSVWNLPGEGLRRSSPGELVLIRPSVAAFSASKKNLTTVAFTPDGKTLATAGLGDDIHVWTLPAGTRDTTLTGHKTAVMALTMLKHSATLVSLGYEQTVRFWDTATWQESRIVVLEDSGVRGMAFSPDEQNVALSLESRVQVRQVADWSLKAELPISTKVISALVFSPDGRWLLAGAADRKIRVWDLAQARA